MCQCLVCECWWCNFCGVCCAGCADFMCCCSFWCCKPDDLEQFDRQCCHCCDGFAGWGSNFFCEGSVCCSPDYLKKWSVFRTTGAIGNNAMPNSSRPQQQQQGGYRPQQQGYPQQQGFQQQQGYQQQGYQQGGYAPQYGNQGGPTRIVINH